MCDNVCIEVNETVENISIEVRDFSVLNVISEDANNSATIGSDGLLFVPENTAGGTVTSVNGILPDEVGNVVVPIPTVPDFADQTETNAGVVTDKTIAPNTLAGWWTYVKGLAQTFAQKITFSSGALFSPQSQPTHERGRVYFDDVNDCLSFMDSITGTSVQVGYEVLMRARNNTGATITNGSVVYISGAIGQNSTVALAQANTLPTSEIIGIATHDIANNTVGKICVFGLVNDFNTSSFTDGQMLYLSASVAGGLTSTIPASPNFVVALGVVEHAHPTQGKILVRPQRALANNNALGTAQNVPPTQNAVKTAIDLKQDKLTETNFGQFLDLDINTKLTPMPTDTIVGRDSITNEAVEFNYPIVEGYFNGTNFYLESGFVNMITATTGRTYIDLDTNLQYRWSGSAYVQIGGVNAKTENYFRNIFSENYFTNSNNYNLFSVTPTFVNGRMRLTGGLGNFNQYLTFKNLTNTDENIEIEVIFQATVIGAGGFGVAIGKRSVNTWYNASIAAHFSPIQSTAYLWDSNSATQISSKVTSTVNVNDVISLKYTQLGNEVAVTVLNITQNKIVQSKMLNNLGVVKNFKIPNTSDLALWNLGGTNDIISISVNSFSNYQPNLLCVGDSKTFGYSATSKKLRFASNLPYGIVMVNAGDGDRTVEVNSAINYTKKIKAKQVLLSIGRNDLASGVSALTWQTNYQNIVTQLQNEGSIVYHLLPIPETNLADQSILKNWIISTYGSGNCIDPSVGWDNASMLSSDNVHPNSIGHAFITKKIIDSNLINVDFPIEVLPKNNEMNFFQDYGINNVNYIPYSSGSSFLDSEIYRLSIGKYGIGTNAPYNYGNGYNSLEIAGTNYGILTLSKIGNTRRFYISSDGVNAYFGVNNNGVFKNVFTIDLNGNINFNSVGNVLTDESAKLQIDSTTQGFLPPRMTTTQRNAIVSPTAGLIVYDITENKHYGFNGTTWNALY